MSGNSEVSESRTRAVLAEVALGDDEWGRAERLLRKLANRHGCTREHCPDRRAHARDVAAMAPALEAAGFVPYEPGVPPKQKQNHRRTP